MFVNKINIKHYYRFIEFSLKLLNKELTHNKFKLIALDEYKCETKQEQEVKRFANAFSYVLNNSKQIINKSLLKNIYYLMEGKELDEDNLNKIMELIYLDYDKSAYYLAAKIHLDIFDNNFEAKEKYAFLILNLILLKKGKNIILLREKKHTLYQEIIKEKSINRLVLLIMENEVKEKVNRKEKIPSISRVNQVIKKNKEKLTNKYKVEKMYLYGSITNGMLTKDSDVDFVIKYSDKCSEIDCYNYTLEIKKILSNELNYQKLDFIKFNTALEKMDLEVFENIKTLI